MKIETVYYLKAVEEFKFFNKLLSICVLNDCVSLKLGKCLCVLLRYWRLCMRVSVCTCKCMFVCKSEVV